MGVPDGIPRPRRTAGRCERQDRAPLFPHSLEIITKADDSPVTIADRETETALRQMVKLAYPDHGLIGEEFPAERADAEFVWVFDPIDGTKSFITGRPLFGTLIALLHRGKPILGVIDHPAIGERWIGASGCPTTFQGKPVKVRPCADLGKAVLAASSPHMFGTRESDAAFNRVRARRASPSTVPIAMPMG